MTLKGEGNGPLPPLLVQYTELRERYPDYLLLFQVGDFYETFGEDAERFARAINITLTHKTSKDFSTPMAGIPVRSADTYLEKLLKQNVCVAIADQTEVATAADGLVKREVTQLVTPGTVTDEKLLRPDANYLAAVATGEGYGLTLLDVTTGEFRGTLLYSKAALFDELRRYRPAELLLAPELYAQEDFREGCSERFAVMVTRGRFDEDAARDTLGAHFGTVPQGADDAVMRAAGAVLSYALTTQRGQLAQVTRFFALRPRAPTCRLGRRRSLRSRSSPQTPAILRARATTRARCSAFSTRPAPRRGAGSCGAWLRHPLLEKPLIEARLGAVEAFVRDTVLRREVRKALYKLHDLERLASKLVTNRANARDLCALSRSLALVPELKALLMGRSEGVIQALTERLDGLGSVHERIRAALVDNPPLKLTEGGLIQSGFDSELDEVRARAENGRAWIAALEASERAATGIPDAQDRL